MMVVVFVVVLKVVKCDIYIDVIGVFMIDLCYVEDVCKFYFILYDEMLELVNLGVGVLYLCVVEFVKNYQVLLEVCLSLENENGMIVEEEVLME